MLKSLNVYRCRLIKDHAIQYIAQIGCPDDAVKVALELGFVEYSEEVFGMFALNTKGHIIGIHEVARGDISTVVISPREVFKRALLNNSAAVIFVHNHPSGDTMPSEADVEVTQRLVAAGEIMGINVLDHIIIGNEYNDSFSMKKYNLI